MASGEDLGPDGIMVEVFLEGKTEPRKGLSCSFMSKETERKRERKKRAKEISRMSGRQ